MITVACRWCGTEYQTTTENDVYCSQVCMDAAEAALMEAARTMTVPMSIVEAVARALERLSRPGVEGWGLRVFGDMEAAGDLVVLTEHNGCTSETCSHWSHDPAAPELRWVPRDGRLISLGYDLEPDETTVSYYAHIVENDVRYVRLVEPQFFHAEAGYIDEADVPEWALARLAEEAAV